MGEVTPSGRDVSLTQGVRKHLTHSFWRTGRRYTLKAMTVELPQRMQEWTGVIMPTVYVVLIVGAAWILQRVVRGLLGRLGERYSMPPELLVGVRRVSGFLIYSAALLVALERLGVSGTVLWTAFTGFAAVGAVAFFAAWSVLSNIFCALLIFTTRPFRLYDYIELVETSDKPGLRGQVVDINVVYTTLEDVAADGGKDGSVLQIPNSLFFQRPVRRWAGSSVPRRWILTP
jgi:small-conductance mechanosensitive channel